MFFEKDKNPYVDDPIFDATPTLKYSAKARKILKMHRIFVEQKTEMLGDSNDPSCIPNPETVEKAGIPQQCQKAGKLIHHLFLYISLFTQTKFYCFKKSYYSNRILLL